MKGEYNNLLNKFAGIVGVAGASLLISMPIQANVATNNPSQNVLVNQYNLSQATKASPKKSQQKVAQNRGGALNPSPSIFNEPPYNGRSRTAPGTTPPPSTTPPGTEQPTPTPPTTPPGATTGQGDIIAIAQANGQFTKLTEALKAAGLIETLQGKGPFTVFAPTDAAFAELPQDAVQDLLKPENREVLLKILTYHVVPRQVLSSELKSGEVKSVEGGPISIKVDGKKGVMVNDAKVVKADVKATNGVIHVIDKVILPPDL